MTRFSNDLTRAHKLLQEAASEDTLRFSDDPDCVVADLSATGDHPACGIDSAQIEADIRESAGLEPLVPLPPESNSDARTTD